MLNINHMVMKLQGALSRLDAKVKVLAMTVLKPNIFLKLNHITNNSDYELFFTAN